jgi:hypothetical protein
VLEELTLLTNKLRQQVLSNDSNTVSQEERIRLYQNAIQPAEALNISSAYIPNFILSFSLHRCDPSKRKFTLLGSATPR